MAGFSHRHRASHHGYRDAGFGATIPAAGISGAVLGILLWYAFDRLLDVTLPLGAWLS